MVSDTDGGSLISLLDEIHLDVSAIKFSGEDLFLGIEIISLESKTLMLVAHDCDGVLGIVSDDNVNDILASWDVVSGCEVLEEAAILLELLEALDVC